jgi:ArsR family transcriptional regulator
MQNNESAMLLDCLKALASPVRLSILAALRTPLDFPEQVDGDRVIDGICADFIRERVNLSAATVSRHLGLLAAAGFLIATRRKGWTFYRRDELAIQDFTSQLSREV